MKFIINANQLIIQIGSGHCAFPNTATGYRAMTAKWQQWRRQNPAVKKATSGL